MDVYQNDRHLSKTVNSKKRKFSKTEMYLERNLASRAECAVGARAYPGFVAFRQLRVFLLPAAPPTPR